MKAGAPTVVVIGTIFVDMKCFPVNELHCKSRNLGHVEFFHGGVGRNVAESMALLGSNVRFSSSVQEGGIGHEVLTRLHEADIDVDGVNVVNSPDGHGMWVAILQRDGDLACSISQLPNPAHMEDAWKRHGQKLLKDASLVVLELDLAPELPDSVLWDAHAAGVRVVGLPGNFEAVRRRPDLLTRLDTFICNQYEAEELYGKPIASIPAAKAAAVALLERGMRQMVITLGGLGVVAVSRENREPVHVPAHQVEVVDTTGAGDAFVAGFSHAMARGAFLELGLQVATRVAAWTVSANESVCRDLPERIAADQWEGWTFLSR